MFWGSGSAVRQKKISETQVVYNRYRYAHFMFISRTTWGYHYILATLGKDGWHHKDITKEEALQLKLSSVINLLAQDDEAKKDEAVSILQEMCGEGR